MHLKGSSQHIYPNVLICRLINFEIKIAVKAYMIIYLNTKIQRISDFINIITNNRFTVIIIATEKPIILTNNYCFLVFQKSK